MKKILLFLGTSIMFFSNSIAQKFPQKQDLVNDMLLANSYFVKKWPDPTIPIISDKVRKSNLWTRGVYYEGLMELYKITQKKELLDYTKTWAEGHKYSLIYGPFNRHADGHCAAQTYIDLYLMEPSDNKIKETKANIDSMLNTSRVNDWTWIDALQMAMPVFAKLGVIYKNDAYFEKMYALYEHSKNVEGGGLYNKTEKLWWRDKDFVPPYKTPGGKNCYWSRGNGWVVAALVKVMEIMPPNAPHYDEYKKTYLEMMEAILPLQREDGFWNVSLTDPSDYGGKELSGTALFAYGMAWGMNHGLLDKKKYLKPTLKAWEAMKKDCLHPDGKLGYVQSTGKQPSDGQPLSYDKEANFEDYGLGCYLLAGCEIYRLK
ncbi:MAG: glycoside hydrolase family 88 protein [Spirosomataceae bacterium]